MQEIKQCDNCGAVLSSEFCSQCGQRARSPIVSLREFAGEALNGLFSVDSRIWRTILPLLLKPGGLTCEYLAGRRQRYLPPFRTYLILSLLFFMIASILGKDLEVNVNDVPASANQQVSGLDEVTGGGEEDFSCQDLKFGSLDFIY